MKKIMVAIIACVLLFSMIVPVSAAETYQCAGFTFQSDLDYEVYGGSKMGKTYIGDVGIGDGLVGGVACEFEIDNPGTNEWLGEMCVFEYFRYFEGDLLYDSPSEYPDLFKAIRVSDNGLFSADAYETKIDGFPALVETGKDDENYYGRIMTYDDTLFYLINMSFYEKADLDEAIEDILNADLNNPLPETEILYGEVKTDGKIMKYTIELNPQIEEPSSRPEEESFENGSSSEVEPGTTEAVKEGKEKNDKDDDDEDDSYVEEEDNTIVIVIGVVACVAIVCGTIIAIFVMKSKKK